MVASTDDIREWGKENGWNVVEGERLPTGLRAAYDGRFDDTSAFTTQTPETPWGELPIPEGDGIEEIAPVIREKSTGEKAKSFIDRIKKAAPAAPAKPRGRRPAKPRVPVDKLISMGWRFLAQMAQPINLPVARILDMQAPVAGLILEDTVKGTIVDRLLQPIARAESGGEKVFALLGPPMLVAAITAKPQLYPVLRAPLRESLRLWIDIAGPKLDELKEQEDKFQEQYGTRIDDMIDLIFAPPVPESE